MITITLPPVYDHCGYSACPYCHRGNAVFLRQYAFYDKDQKVILSGVECFCGFPSDTIKHEPSKFFAIEEHLKEILRETWNKTCKDVKENQPRPTLSQ